MNGKFCLLELMNLSIQRVFDEIHKIKEQKFDHLKEIKNSLDKDYHLYNDSLPH